MSHQEPYTKLKDALLASHQLTDFQRVELLHAMEPLGGRKPSELLADMWELCPTEQHDNIFFAMLFLQCLPRDIRVLLTHEDHRNLRLLANANATAVGDFQTDPVAALPGKNTTASSKRSSRPHYRPKHSRGSQKEQYTSAPVALAKDPTGLCFYHWNFGDKANNCTDPCSWQGN